MKTKKQVEHFLNRKKYKSEIDFEGIKLYCSSKFGIKLHHPSAYFPEGDPENEVLDYTTFANWFEHGIGAGDVVKWEDCIGLVQSGGTEEVLICFRIDRNGPNFDFLYKNVQDITLAEESVLKRLYSSLRESGKEFGNPNFCIHEKFVPNSGALVTFHNYETGEDGVGVIKSINKAGDVVMYCWYIKGKPIHYSMDEQMGPSSLYSFQQIQPADYPRKAMEIELQKIGKTWNHSIKRIEPLNMKAEEGQEYYYISDRRKVESAIEKNTGVSHKRYLAGNYFKDYQMALNILELENELRRKILAEPEKEESNPAK